MRHPLTQKEYTRQNAPSDVVRALRARFTRLRHAIYHWKAPKHEDTLSIDILSEELLSRTQRGATPFCLVVDATQLATIDRATQAYIKQKLMGLKNRPRHLSIYTGKNALINATVRAIAGGSFEKGSFSIVRTKKEALEKAELALRQKPGGWRLENFLGMARTRIKFALGGAAFGTVFPFAALYIQARDLSVPLWEVFFHFNPLLFIIFTAPFILAAFSYFIGRAQEDLQTHKNQFSQLLLETTPEGFFGIDLQGRALFVNPAAAQMLGYEEDELIGQPLHALIHHTNEQGAEQVVDNCAMCSLHKNAPRRESREDIFWKKDGTRFYISYKSTEIIHQGALVGLLVSFSDIEEKKRAEITTKATSETRALYARHPGATEKIFDGIIRKFIQMTESTYGFLGEVVRKEDGSPFLKTYSLPEFSPGKNHKEGKTIVGVEFPSSTSFLGTLLKQPAPHFLNDLNPADFSSGFPPGHPRILNLFSLPIFEGEKLVAFICLANRNRGYPSYLSDQLAPLVEATADLIMLLKKDTEAKAQAKIVVQQSRFLKALINAIPLSLTCKDYQNQGAYVAWNHAAEKIWGVKEQKAIGKTDYDFFPAEQALKIQERDKQTLVEKTLLYIDEETIDSPILGRRIFQSWRVPISDATDSHRFLLDLSQDITALRDLEQRLEEQKLIAVQASKLSSLGEMAGGIAHEINNPLAIIQGHASRLMKLKKKNSLSDKELQEKLEKIVNTVERMTNIVSGLRSFSRDGGKDPFLNVPIQKVIRESLDLCRERFRNRHVPLIFEDNFEALYCDCRPVQISQVLINLLSNARAAVEKLPPSDRWVKISLEEKEDRIVLSVSNSGPRIPPQIEERLFQPFFTTKDPGEGTGLGLSISKGLVEAHQGQLYFDKNAVHTAFVLEIPKRHSPSAKAA